MSDVCQSRCHLLHQGICVLLTTAIVSAGTQIAHHEVRDGISKYIFVNETQRNCLAILEPDSCAAGHQIEPCFNDNQKDRCVPCRDGEEQLDKTYSDFRSPCYIFSCPEGTVPGERDPSSGCSLRCRCKSERMVMNKRCSCQHVEVQCGRNTYLKNGVCLLCPSGTLKPGNSAGPCVMKQPPTSHPPEPVSTASPSASEKKLTPSVRRNLTKDVTGKNMTNADISAEENPPTERSSNNQNIYILGITIATLTAVILLVIHVILYRWKRNLPSQCNTAQPNHSNKSLLQPQVAEIGGYPSSDPPPYCQYDARTPVCVNEGQLCMAQPWTMDNSTDQVTGGNQTANQEGGATPTVEVTVYGQDTDETTPKEYHSSDQTTSLNQQHPDKNVDEIESLPCLGSAPGLNTDSFQSDHEK